MLGWGVVISTHQRPTFHKNSRLHAVQEENLTSRNDTPGRLAGQYLQLPRRHGTMKRLVSNGFKPYQRLCSHTHTHTYMQGTQKTKNRYEQQHRWFGIAPIQSSQFVHTKKLHAVVIYLGRDDIPGSAEHRSHMAVSAWSFEASLQTLKDAKKC